MENLNVVISISVDLIGFQEMKFLTLVHPTKYDAPEQCPSCDSSNSVQRVVSLNDKEELVAMRKKNQNRVLINGRWTKIARVATISHECSNCNHREVVWRDIQRKSERGGLAKLVTYRL